MKPQQMDKFPDERQRASHRWELNHDWKRYLSSRLKKSVLYGIKTFRRVKKLFFRRENTSFRNFGGFSKATFIRLRKLPSRPLGGSKFFRFLVLKRNLA
jgi:hypothetical protein